jgi:hypothetical protein
MKKVLFTIIGGAVILSSCSKKVDSNDLKDEVPYYQTYDVNFDRGNNKTTASAVFQVRESNGSKVELSNGASVKLNGTTGSTSNTDKTKYTWDVNGVSDATFTLTKNSGTTITNTVTIAEVGDLGFGTNFPATVSKENGFVYNWSGTPLKTGESIRVTIAPGSTGIPLATKDVNGTEVQFTKNDLIALPTGNVTVTMKRSGTLNLDMQDGNAGGKINASLSTSKTLQITE